MLACDRIEAAARRRTTELMPGDVTVRRHEGMVESASLTVELEHEKALLDRHRRVVAASFEKTVGERATKHVQARSDNGAAEAGHE